MLVPKRVKHRKVQRGHMRGEAKGGKNVTFGEFGLKAKVKIAVFETAPEGPHDIFSRYSDGEKPEYFLKLLPK